MRIRRFFPAIALGLGAMFSGSGCLSLGGSTTYVQESETTLARITNLEHRVKTVEAMLKPVEETSPGYPPQPVASSQP